MRAQVAWAGPSHIACVCTRGRGRCLRQRLLGKGQGQEGRQGEPEGGWGPGHAEPMGCPSAGYQFSSLC